MVSKHLLDGRDAQAQQSMALAAALSNAGISVDIITGDVDGVPINACCKHLIIHALPAKWLTREKSTMGKIKRKINRNLSACVATKWAKCAAHLATKMMRQEHYDAFISIALPMESHIAAMLSDRNTPWIACLSDPWPEALLPAPYSDFSMPVLTAMQYRVVEKTFKAADALVFTCSNEYDFLASSYPALASQKSFVIPHVAPSRFAGDERRSLDASINVIHAGSISRERVCVGLAEAIGKLPQSSRLQFQFIGEIHAEMLSAFKQSGAMHRIQIVDWRSKREVLSTLMCAQAALLVEAKMPCYPFLPSKLADYSATGRPIIAITGSNSTVAHLIDAHQAGFVANHSVHSILGALQEVEQNYRSKTSIALWREFSAENVVSKYISLIKSLRAV